ncbi:deoxyribodipyrimidine photo-lyase [Ferrovibrio sp.]|uniref:cryptochrome/photolyase family protein n=1 Tax=Ferrovibrio sp. TaxID=1917215 RepID=UPI002610A890|nr:deoxyribodipyrimidine photo-lyase [Ferrovibrio sp.]
MADSASSSSPVILWFRQDLRLNDNPALAAAAAAGRPVIALYVLDTALPSWQMGGASRWWLHHALNALATELKRRYGLKLILRRGDAAAILPALARETGAAAVFWNRCYEPAAVARDTILKTTLKAEGIAVETFNASLLVEPWQVKTRTGGWFRVYSPFWRACRALPDPAPPHRAPKKLQAFNKPVHGERLDDWQLLPTQPDWAGGLRATWQPGEAGAAARLQAFIDDALQGYADGRDRPDRNLTSRLSPHLHFGEIGPRQVWQAVQMAAAENSAAARNAETFLSELGWREFAHHLLFHFPALPERNFRAGFDAFPWQDDPALLARWQRGLTGYPIVDAGMRELWLTGWMHNRVRMIAASFLVKHLRQHWRHGEAWFWDTLVDADLANNAASWQWVAGSGADAAPYFRIFNPILQGEKFDPQGGYVRRWLPELARLPDKYIHKPWLAPAAVLREAGLRLGQDYPQPLVDHDAARKAALAAFAQLRNDDRQTAGAA